jgi:VWFA-related protein
VERYIASNDLVAVVNTSGYRKAMQDFTSNRALALRAIDASMGNKAESSTSAALADAYMNQGMPAPAGNPNASFNDLQRYTNARNSLDTLRAVSEFMSGMRGRRKAVVYFSEGINYDITNMISNRYASDVQRELQAVIASATRANVSIYSVDPRGVTSGMEDAIEISGFPADGSISSTRLMDELRYEHDSLRVVSEETGGFAILNQNDFRNAFSRILDDNSSYYVLGYYPSNEKRDGRFRNVQVRLLKPGLQVRHRKGYVAPTSGKKESAAKGTGAERTSPELLDAMESPVAVSGLHLSAFAAPFTGAGANDAVVVSVEVDASVMTFGPKPDGRYANDLEVTLYAIDPLKAKVKDGARDVVGVVLRPQVTQMRSPFRVLRKLQVPPGRYQLRIGARESGGKVGTVLLDVDAPDFTKEPVSMSGVSISSAVSGRIPTATPGGPLSDVLPAPPSASREFQRGDTIDLFVEVYDNLGTQTAHRVVITTTVLADDGKTVFSTSDERRSDELKDSTAGGGFGHTAKIPLEPFAPGRYVLRLEARPTIGKTDPVSREVEFTVR